MVSAAILAGGRARRFGGRDKSTLVVGGRPILNRLLAELPAVADDIMIITGDRDLTIPPGVRAVPDRVPDCGPLGGLDAALAAARHDVLVLVACDMPFVSAPLLAHLAALTASADAVVPRTERGYHPLCAAYTRACAPAAAARLAARELRMVDFLTDVRVRVVTAFELEGLGDAHRLLANVNTPADYGRVNAELGHEL